MIQHPEVMHWGLHVFNMCCVLFVIFLVEGVKSLSLFTAIENLKYNFIEKIVVELSCCYFVMQ